MRHPPPSAAAALRVCLLELIDPIVLGGASTGLVGCINWASPDLSFAFAANRAGVTTREVLDYAPHLARQCVTGITAYMSEGDVLLDVPLAQALLERHSPSGQCVVDKPPDGVGFHGRWLVECWLGGLVWGAPCASRCVDGLLSRLRAAR
jgi:hypothetical protein